MRRYLLLIILAAAGLGTVTFAQSRRVPALPTNEKKTNQRDRPVEPTPSPTPDETVAEDDGQVISVSTRLVTVPVRVLDRKNRFIGGLKKENFSIFEDEAPQELAFFSNEAQPFTVALVMDMSYSSTFKIEDIQSAAIAFIDQLRPSDKVMVISFDEEVHLLCEPTSDRQRIYAAIRNTKISTGTSLYEAMDMTMNLRMRPIEGRKAIVLFTDGVDTTSRRANDIENLRDAMELDALIYPIRYDTYADVQAMKRNPPIAAPPPGLPIPDSSTRIPNGTPGTLPTGFPFPFPTGTGRTTTPVPRSTPDPRGGTRMPDEEDPLGVPTRPPVMMPGQRGTTAAEYRFAEEYLNQLAFRTGGRVNLASSLSNLNAAFAKIASELREFYSIGYYPKEDSEAGKTRRIKVRVDQENMVVKARDSYVVGSKRKPE